MNSKLIESIANAVLYEGYMLYPYRPSAVKNRQRWNFGVIYPRTHCEIQNGSDSWFMQTAVPDPDGNASATVDIKVRFLQAVSRQMGKLDSAIAEGRCQYRNLKSSNRTAVGDKDLRSPGRKRSSARLCFRPSSSQISSTRLSSRFFRFRRLASRNP